MNRWLPADRGAQGPLGRWAVVMGLTLARIPLAAAFASVLLTGGNRAGESVNAYRWGALAMLAVIELTDGLDGFLARRWQVPSKLGAIADPYADSVSRLTVYWALAAAGLTSGVLPLVMAVRDITVAYCRLVWVDANLSPGALLSGKLKAVAQGVGAFTLLLGPMFVPSWDWLGPLTTWFVGLATLASLIAYVGRTAPLLRRPPHSQATSSAESAVKS